MNEILAKLPRTITGAQADRSMNETLIDLLQRNRGEKRGGKRLRGKWI